MVIDDILSAAGFLKNNLQSFIEYWTKGVQILLDSLYDPADDNSHEIITLPPEFYLTVYKETRGKNYTDAYLDRSGGMQPFLFAFTVKLQDGVLSFPNLQYLGRTYSGNWSYLTDAEADALENLVREYPLELETYSDYPTEPVLLHYSGYSNYSFKPRFHDPKDMGYEFTDFNGGHQVDSLNIQFINGDMTMSGDYIDFSFNLYDFDYAVCRGFFKQPFMMVTDSMTAVNDYITSNDADHNYSDSVTTGDGDDFTVYYGDNYIIYYIPTAHKLSYNDIQNTTQRVVNKIVSDNPSMTPIHVPTYDENKFGPEPPPEPDPDKDDIDDQVIGAGTNLGSIARLWLLTRQQLIDLHNAFTSAPANYDPLTSFIGVLGFGVQPIKVVGDSLPWTLNPINIRMSNGELWHTGVEAHIIDKQVSAFSFPDINIKKRYNNFLDYSPYATHEIFIPMCGWLTLPDIAVDRTISVTYLPDIESMKCRAVVSVVDDDGDKCVIGVKDGIMGAEIPFSNLNHSVWLANLITNAADVAGEMVTGAIGAGFTKTTAKGATYRPYEGFTIGMAGGLPGAVGNALLSGNVNRTHVVGSNGNRTGFSDGESIMIKSTYHKIDKPDNYDHTFGKVCNKTGQLSEFNGFTVCDNPHINISALDEEKEEIKRLLEEGVILPSGE